MNSLLTEQVIRKEVYTLTKNSRYDYCVSLTSNKLQINSKWIELDSSSLSISLDDFSEKYIKPLLFIQHDWDRAFKLETWV